MFNLKVVLLLTFCFAELYAIPPEMLTVLPEEVIQMIYTLRGICSSQHGLTKEDIESYVITNTDEKFKCYMKCMLLEANWMSPEGIIHFESILDNSHSVIKPVLTKLFEKCDQIPDSPEPCGKAYNFHACLAAADPKHYFLP